MLKEIILIILTSVLYDKGSIFRGSIYVNLLEGLMQYSAKTIFPIRIIIVILFFNTILIKTQSIYYVSSSNGADSNSGISESLPWKTISMLNNKSFSPGDKILFKRGDKWEEGIGLIISNSGSENNSIIFGAYGEGDKPILSLKSEIAGWDTESNWSKTEGDTIWKISFPNLLAEGRYCNRLWFTQNEITTEYPIANGLSGDNLDNLTSGQSKTYGVNQKHRFYHDGSKNPSILYVWTDGTNPASYYSNIEHPGKYTSNSGINNYTIELKDADFVVLDNLDIQGGIFGALALGGSDNVIIQNCNLGKYSNRMGICGDTKRAYDKTSDNVEVSNCIIDSDWKVKVNFQNNSVVEYAIWIGSGASNWNIHNNFIKNFKFGFLTVSNYGISKFHKFYNNEVTSPDIAYCKPVQLGGTGDVYENGNHEIYNNYFHDITVGVQVSGGSGSRASNNNKFYFNIFKIYTASENIHASAGNSGIGFSILSGSDYTYIFNNTFYQMNNSAITDWSDKHTYVYNNLIVNTGLKKSYPIQVQAHEKNIYYKNNILYHYALNSSSKIINFTNLVYYTIDQFNKLNGTNGKIATDNAWMGTLVSKTINNITIPISTKKGIDISSLIPSGFKDRNGILVNRTSPTIGAVSSSTTSSLMVKVFLQAPFDELGSMNSALKASEKIPLLQSYNQPPWNYMGNENVQEIPAGVVDWVLVELRTDISSASTVSRRAAFIKSDGSIVDLDGISNISFSDIDEGSYFIVVKHRNHLGIMSADKITIGEFLSFYDFTTSPSKAYGNELADLSNNEYGMYAGDADGNGVIDINDYSIIENRLFQTGYKEGDLDLDGKVNVLDYIVTKQNFKKTSKIP